MSLIHDSLRKLETKQVKNLGSGFNSQEGSYNKPKSLILKKLWMGVVLVIGGSLVFYAYTVLEKYQKQNEMLLNDMKNMKSSNISIEYKNTKEVEQPIAKVIVQPPAIIKSPPKQLFIASQERQKEVTELNRKLVNSEINKKHESKLVAVKEQQREVKSETDNKKKLVIVKTTPTKKTYKKKTSNKKKLTVKQTRQLVNNLQMQIDLKNVVEVEKLLAQLAKSSGNESLIFLRMNAFWSNINHDSETAVMMYKKILFQKPYDIQAGTNLALIEAKNNQKSQALKRLELLKNKYPANTNILDYFNKIEAN